MCGTFMMRLLIKVSIGLTLCEIGVVACSDQKKKENIQRSVGLLWMPSQRKIKTNSLEYCDHGELIRWEKADRVHRRHRE